MWLSKSFVEITEMALYFVNKYVTMLAQNRIGMMMIKHWEVGTELKRELDDIENGKRRKNKWTLGLRL